jgi:hypothetical protein
MKSHPTEWDAESFGPLICDEKKVFDRADRSRTFKTRRANTHKKRPRVTGAVFVRLSVTLLSAITHRQMGA